MFRHLRSAKNSFVRENFKNKPPIAEKAPCRGFVALGIISQAFEENMPKYIGEAHFLFRQKFNETKESQGMAQLLIYFLDG